MAQTEKYRELLSLTKQFLLQQEDKTASCDSKTASYFGRDEKGPKGPYFVPLPLPEKKPPLPPPAKAAPKKEPEPNPVPVPEITPLKAPLPKIVSAPLPDFHLLKTKLKGYGITIPTASIQLSDENAKKISDAWKKKVPQVIILSFFPVESIHATLLKNVTAAINTKLTSAAIIQFPGKESLTELSIYAEHRLLKAIFIASDSSTRAKMNEFLLPLDLEENKTSDAVMTPRGKLDETPLFELLITEKMMNSKEEKHALWNSLKAAIAS